ncbi:MAG: type I methionyl aminopeptidase [Candidatus Paceibacterota bacterium]|jgi:methionyl aminopeptidase
MIKLKTKAEIEILREGGQRLAVILATIKARVAPGVKTIDLENLARELIKRGGDEPAFLGYKPQGSRRAYPAALCVSVNEEIVHGLPSERILEVGDIVGLDLGLKHEGLFTDMAVTVPVGPISPEAENLLATVEQALEAGLAMAQPGRRMGDIGHAIELVIKENGFKVVKELAGHGVGYQPHEDPFVPNFGKAGMGDELLPGLVIAIEPMATSGRGDIKVGSDGFTFLTKDGKLASHTEKTIVITETGHEILTTT